MIRAIAVLALVACPALADPQARLPVEAVVTPERNDETVKISGPYLAGVMYAGAEPLEDRPSLRAHVPVGWAGEPVCMRAISADGVYEFVTRYRIPADWPAEGVIDFAYETDHPDVLGAAADPEFAVSLARGDCLDEAGAFLVGYWNASDDQGGRRVVLLLNSLGADEAWVYVGDDPAAEPVDCAPVEVERPRAFDRRCVLDPEALDGGQVRIEINTVSGGVFDPPRFVELVLPRRR